MNQSFQKIKKQSLLRETKNYPQPTASSNNTRPKLTGIGGIFFFSSSVPRFNELCLVMDTAFVICLHYHRAPSTAQTLERKHGENLKLNTGNGGSCSIKNRNIGKRTVGNHRRPDGAVTRICIWCKCSREISTYVSP